MKQYKRLVLLLGIFVFIIGMIWGCPGPGGGEKINTTRPVRNRSQR